ncbi:MAG: DMT family transporter [Gammaproteobacteria bacterium]|nr:DMT family transporter [Gammaproteobacteria bacterium]
MNSTLVYASIMLVAGLGIPVMAALNAGLGEKLQSPALATMVLLLGALVIAVAYFYVIEGGPSIQFNANIPWYFYLGGLFFIFYILTITWVAPKFGIANAVAYVLLGQLIAMIIIDHFGLFHAPVYTISLQRALGIILMIAGVFLVLSRPVDT